MRHIIVTHLDLDRAGGIADFPAPQVHILDSEYTAATSPNTFTDKYRYRPCQWEHQPHWVRHKVQGEQWFGFECVRQIEGLPPEILLVPLLGHTRGHTGVAVYTQGSWLLHAGDAYYYRNEMDYHQPQCPLGLRIVQRIGAVDRQAWRKNQQRLRQLARDRTVEVRIFSAHDPIEFELMASEYRTRQQP